MQMSLDTSWSVIRDPWCGVVEVNPNPNPGGFPSIRERPIIEITIQSEISAKKMPEKSAKLRPTGRRNGNLRPKKIWNDKNNNANLSRPSRTSGPKWPNTWPPRPRGRPPRPPPTHSSKVTPKVGPSSSPEQIGTNIQGAYLVNFIPFNLMPNFNFSCFGQGREERPFLA